MKVNQFSIGVVCLLVGIILYVLDVTHYIGVIESTKIMVYPAAAIALLGIWQIYLSVKPIFKR